MTSESKADTEPWIEKHEAEYGYAYDPDRALASSLGISGIPHAVLIDPAGTIVWRGHPAVLEASTIEEHLGGRLRTPMWDWPEAATPIADAIRSGSLKAALDSLEAPVDPTLIDEIRSVLRRQVTATLKQFEVMLQEEDALGAEATLERSRQKLAGLPEAVEFDKLVEQLSTEALKAARVLQVDLNDIEAKLMGSFGGDGYSKAELDELEQRLRTLSKTHAGKAVGRKATELQRYVDAVQRMLESR